MKKPSFLYLICLFAVLAAGASCSRTGEISGEDLDSLEVAGLEELLSKTVSKPWLGEDFVPGVPGGVWNGRVTEDPKTFNILKAERDTASASIVGAMRDYLLDYDMTAREWKPRCASAEVTADEAAGTLTVTYTLRDDLYWSFYNSDRKVKVTSDDIVFWYNEIQGDQAFQSTGYNGQFLLLEDGTEAHIDIEKIDSRRFAFHFPRIVAEPLLSTNLTIAPRLGYEEAKKKGGVEGVLNLYTVETDPKTIPSMGEWFLTEYASGQRLVYERNPNYWDKDTNGRSVPYPEKQIVQIIPDTNTEKLLFQQGKVESYTIRPEDLDEIVNAQGQDYTVFSAEGTLSSAFWTFNQNPVNKDQPWYEWFTQKEFRQAMSCFLNRDRIAAQVYRGLADPKYNIFPQANPFYDPAITLSYRYDPKRALELLASIGMKRDRAGVMRDSKGRAVEFDLVFQTDATVYSDTASIIMDELSKAGIKINIRVMEFQKLIQQLTETFNWPSAFVRLSGSQIFPSQGSNVWPSGADLHFWYPLQEKPATGWEARVDYLYNEGSYTIDPEKAKAYWDEFQKIILEQCPIIYLMRQRSFVALWNRWDLTNVYYDNLNGFKSSHIFLKQ